MAEIVFCVPHMSITLEDISKATGFSVPTVSRVLSNSRYPVSDATRQRILEVAQAIGYRPNLSARSLRTERTDTIGILVDDIMSPFAPPLVRGIQDFFNDHAISCLVMNSDWRPDIEEMAIESLLSRGVDGIIFAEYSHLVVHDALIRSQKPHLFVHRLFAKSVQNSILPDDYYGASLAVRHLLDFGHRRIAYISGPTSWHANQHRFNAYRDALAQRDIAIDPALIQSGDWESDSGYAAAAQLLEHSKRPTAIFAANDLIALGAIYRLQEAGLSVPGDVAVVGYDDRDFAKIVKPRLTTVSLPVYEMGQIAAEKLLAQINGGITHFDETLVKGTLFVRESCGADPAMRTKEQHIRATDVRTTALHKDPEV
jgi:LacI family transcriptional regulator